MGLADITKDSGQARLEALGYKQVLKRNLSVLSNFALSFAIISILLGVSTLYTTGLRYGGTISMVYGWLIAGLFNFLVALSMAEICSAFPTSGGLYFWSFRLATPSWAPFAAWITGWFSVVGQGSAGPKTKLASGHSEYKIPCNYFYMCISQFWWAMTTSGNYSLALLLQSMILLATGGGNGGGYYASKYMVIGFHAAILFSQALINSLSITVLSFMGTLASAWNLVGVLVLMILVPLVSTQRQSTKFVFTSFNTDTGVGIHSEPYIFLLGLLICPYAFIGYDASVHMSEETKASDKNGAYGILSAVGISTVFGWAYLLGIAFATVDPQHVLDPGNDAKGYAIAQVFHDAFYSRYGSGTGGIVCLGVVGAAIWFAGMAAVTGNSRMVFAFSRDGALPLSKLWRVVDRREVPVNAVWLSACVAFIMALTSLGSLVAFQAMVSIATLGQYIAYALPILFRVTAARNSFVPGPFSLGRRLSLVVGWAAVLWVAALTVLFCLPVAYPVNTQTFNYTPVVVGGVFVIVVSWWVLRARKWFRGPVYTIEKDSNPN